MKAKESGGNHRQARVEKELREVVGTYLLSGFRGDLPGIISVTRVIVTGDLRQAKVFVRSMSLSEECNRKEVVGELQAHAYEIQRS